MIPAGPHPGPKSWLVAVLWLALALAGMFSVVALNGRPLFYFDTAGYVAQGETALNQLGWRAEAPPALSTPGQDGAAAPAADVAVKGTVDGSRSAVYALFAGLFARLGLLEGLIALNAAAVILSVWLMVRVVLRNTDPARSARFMAIPILAACLGSLPFFVAYLMPDLLAPVMILNLALLGVYGRRMRWPEVALALALASLAIVSHLSHLAIAILMLPVVVIAGAVLGHRR